MPDTATHSHLHSTANKKADTQRVVDKLVYVAAIVEPLFLFPQAYQLFLLQDARAIYIPTWVGMNVLTAVWIWYSVIHRQHAVFVYQSLFFMVNTAIILGGMLFGGRWI